MACIMILELGEIGFRKPYRDFDNMLASRFLFCFLSFSPRPWIPKKKNNTNKHITGSHKVLRLSSSTRHNLDKKEDQINCSIMD